jgi:tripeptide aminopeptidase
MVIEINGVASHAGVHPQHGVSAIAIAGLAIAKIHNDGWHGDVRKGRRRGTSNIGLIEGGSASNVVAPSAWVHAEARSHDRSFRKRILGAIVHAFEQAARSVRNQAGQCGTVKVESGLDYESFRLSPGEPSVMAAEDAIRSIGAQPEVVTIDGGLDANVTTMRGIPTVTLGAGQHHPHTVDEVLHVKEFENGCRIALRLATGQAAGV